jgi:hypothetical protein
MADTLKQSMKMALTVAALALMAAPARALPITFFGSGTNGITGSNLSASVTFDTSGTSLLVTLTNTSVADTLAPSDVLTGVFFNISGNPTLGRVSAVLGSGSTVLFAVSGTGTGPGNVVGGEWAYEAGLAGAPGGAKQGISSSGLGLFASSYNFPGDNLQGPADVDGLQYGIVSAGYAGGGNAAVTGKNALIENSVDFTLSGLPAGFSPSDISGISFQYGTALTEPNIPGCGPNPPPPVREPGTMLLLGSGLLGLAVSRRLRSRSTEALADR